MTESDAMTHIYGIPNCDTVKKARAWLVERGISYEFHDYKKEGVDSAALKAWCEALGWEKLLNRQGTTWRKLDAETQQAASDSASAQQLMREQPSLIKRPVVKWGNGAPECFTVGFDEAAWVKRLS
jgi:arsenate reductase (glutaredoxin)